MSGSARVVVNITVSDVEHRANGLAGWEVYTVVVHEVSGPGDVSPRNHDSDIGWVGDPAGHLSVCKISISNG